MKPHFLFPAIIAALFFAGQVAAQPVSIHGQGPRSGKANEKTLSPGNKCHQDALKLTDQQIEKMDALKLKTLKETQKLKNEIAEKQARLHTLSTADKADMNAINKTIDEISVLRAGIQKIHMAQRQEVRKLLSDDQRIIFDARPMRGGDKHQGMSKIKGKEIHARKCCIDKD